MNTTIFRIEGDAEALELLSTIFAANALVEIHVDERGDSWLVSASLNGLSEGQAFSSAQRFLDIASGAMRLFAGTSGKIIIKNVNYHDTETGRAGSIAVDLFSVRAPFNPSSLVAKSSDDRTAGEVLLLEAQRDPEISRALGILANGGQGWWEIYILLEVLRDHYGKVEGRRSCTWELAFDKLAEAHTISKRRLRDLKRTADFFRHASKKPPRKSWSQPEAAEFVRNAVRHWLVQDRRVLQATVGDEPPD